MRFDGKTALVTGGNAGIGKATALAYARAGANVAVAARREAQGQAVVDAIMAEGGTAAFFKVDVTSDTEVARMVTDVVERFGQLDIAFNNAGYGGMMVPCADFEEDIFDATIAVNLKGVWLCMKHEIRAMLKSGGGAIVNNSSAAGLNGGPYTGVAYCSSKHAVVGLSKAAAAEYAGKGIRINCICPGVVGTEMSSESFDGDEARDALAARHPIGRIGNSEEIAQAVLFLTSDQSPFLVGAAIPIDGGLTLDF